MRKHARKSQETRKPPVDRHKMEVFFAPLSALHSVSDHLSDQQPTRRIPQWNRGQGKVQGGRTGAPAAQLHGGQREGNGVLIVSLRFPLSRQTGAMVPLGRGAAAFIMLSSAAAFTILSVCFLCAGFAVHCQRTATEARRPRQAQSSRERGLERRLRLERALQVLQDLDAQYDLELQVLTRGQTGPEQGGSNDAIGARLQRHPDGPYRSGAADRREITGWRSTNHNVAGGILEGSPGSSSDSYSPPRRMTLWSHKLKMRSCWNSNKGSPVHASARGKSRCYAAACDEARLYEAREASRLVVAESLGVWQRGHANTLFS